MRSFTKYLWIPLTVLVGILLYQQHGPRENKHQRWIHVPQGHVGMIYQRTLPSTPGIEFNTEQGKLALKTLQPGSYRIDDENELLKLVSCKMQKFSTTMFLEQPTPTYTNGYLVRIEGMVQLDCASETTQRLAHVHGGEVPMSGTEIYDLMVWHRLSPVLASATSECLNVGLDVRSKECDGRLQTALHTAMYFISNVRGITLRPEKIY